MTRTDQGYSIYDQVFERAEMLSTIEGLSAIARTKAGARHVLKVPLFANWRTSNMRRR
jgi:hypothetical protein